MTLLTVAACWIGLAVLTLAFLAALVTHNNSIR
jgi:hypothetical protein